MITQNIEECESLIKDIISKKEKDISKAIEIQQSKSSRLKRDVINYEISTLNNVEAKSNQRPSGIDTKNFEEIFTKQIPYSSLKKVSMISNRMTNNISKVEKNEFLHYFTPF